jgi:hypothetical protein
MRNSAWKNGTPKHTKSCKNTKNDMANCNNNKTIGLIFACIFIFMGCAEIGRYRANKLAEFNSYLSSPNNDVVIFVDYITHDLLNTSQQIECHTSVYSLGNTHNESGYYYTPFVLSAPTGDLIKQMSTDYQKLSSINKGLLGGFLIEKSPHFSISCQSQLAIGIKGEIYFNGKKVASDVANIQYGVINLFYQLPLEKIIPENP